MTPLPPEPFAELERRARFAEEYGSGGGPDAALVEQALLCCRIVRGLDPGPGDLTPVAPAVASPSKG